MPPSAESAPAVPSTAQLGIAPGAAGDGGWRELAAGEAEAHLGSTPEAEQRVLAAFVHLSDAHVCDAQSPLRAPYLDRISDPHSPLAEVIGGPLGGYRPQEALTSQVLEAAIRSINRLETAPLTGARLQAAVATGDLTDNAQLNELDWVQAIAEGGRVTPDSGDPSRYEGPGARDNYVTHYWNPDGTPAGEQDDNPRGRYGFPEVPGLFDAVRASYQAEGLNLPWLAVHGNHDLLVQGTVTASEQTEAIAVGDTRAIGFKDPERMVEFLSQFKPQGPASWPASEHLNHEPTTADPERRLVWPETWGERFDALRPSSPRQKFFTARIGELFVIALDTVNPWGGWDGSIDEQQFDWLQRVLEEHQNERILVLSHHPFSRLINDYAPVGKAKRVLAEPIIEALTSHGGVLLWLAGHRHRHAVEQIGDLAAGGFWHVETASLIDWPQQFRTVEVSENDAGEIEIGLTVYDHLSAVNPIENRRPSADFALDRIEDLAGLSRLLAANDWQRRSGAHEISNYAGAREDRNVILKLPARRNSRVR
jgi:metallophosphoesterase (TIGR03767 family)